MKIVIDKESIINVFTISLYATLGGDYNAVKDAVKELLEKINYEPYEDRPTDKWIPVSERLPEETFNPKTQDFGEVLCTTIWDDVRVYKFGQPIECDRAHFWDYGKTVDESVIAWMPLPEPYKKGGAEND